VLPLALALALALPLALPLLLDSAARRAPRENACRHS
jgi:hypothetical protein